MSKAAQRIRQIWSELQLLLTEYSLLRMHSLRMHSQKGFSFRDLSELWLRVKQTDDCLTALYLEYNYLSVG